MNEIEIVQSLIKMINALKYDDLTGLDAFRKRATMIIINMHGENSRYLKDLDRISFDYDHISEENNKQGWKFSQSKVLNILNTMLEELELFGTLK